MKKEERYSSIVADILNIACKDDYFVYKSFLNMLDKAINNNSTIFSNLPVKAPVIKTESREDKVDISIKDNGYRIFIENKINGAQDLKGQLARYIEGSVNGAHYFEKDVYIVYITNSKRSPKSYSWIRLDDKFIATDYEDDFKQRFVNITGSDICRWLEEDVRPLLCNCPKQCELDRSLEFLRMFTNDNSSGRKNNEDESSNNVQEIMTNWGKYIECLYCKDDKPNITVSDTKIDLKFNWPSSGNILGCRFEIYPDKFMCKYGIYKIGETEYFTKDNLDRLFDLFFKIDRYHDRYCGFEILKGENDWLACKTVNLWPRLWSPNDYEIQFALKYYLLDLINKIMMFIIAPSKVGLLSPIEIRLKRDR